MTTEDRRWPPKRTSRPRKRDAPPQPCGRPRRRARPNERSRAEGRRGRDVGDDSDGRRARRATSRRRAGPARRAPLRLRRVLRGARSRSPSSARRSLDFAWIAPPDAGSPSSASRATRSSCRSRRSSARGVAFYYWYRTRDARARRGGRERAVEGHLADRDRGHEPHRRRHRDDRRLDGVLRADGPLLGLRHQPGLRAERLDARPRSASWPRSGTSSRPTRATRTRSERRSCSASRSTTRRPASARSSSRPRR